MRIKFEDSENKEHCFSLEEIDDVNYRGVEKVLITLKNGDKYTAKGKIKFIK